MNGLNKDWSRFGPQTKSPVGALQFLPELVTSEKPDTKFNVIESWRFSSGLNSRVVSKAFIFESYLSAFTYTRRRLKQHEESNHKELRKLKKSPIEQVQVLFSIQPVYEK